MNLGMGLASVPLSSSIGTTIISHTHPQTRQLNHPHLFSTFASSHFPLSLLSRESTNLNPRQPLLSFTRYTTCKLSRGQVEVEDGVNEEEACELVNGIELSIGDGTESIDAYLFKAVKNNNGTGILLLSDVFGFEDSSTRDFAYRVACNGYNVLVPDLFRGDPWAKDRPKALFEEWLAKQPLERVSKDITTCTKWMMDEFVAAGISKKLGIIGFSFGGGQVIDVLAHDQGTCFGIGVSFEGVMIDPSVASSLKVPVLFVVGDNDPICPVSVVEEVENTSEKGSTKVMIFRGRGHGFVHRPQSPEEDGDAEKAFLAMRNWLNDGLVLGT